MKSDDELIKMVTRSGFMAPTGTDKAAAMKVLQKRGYTIEDIKSRRSG
jgi:hypothetical protein